MVPQAPGQGGDFLFVALHDVVEAFSEVAEIARVAVVILNVGWGPREGGVVVLGAWRDGFGVVAAGEEDGVGGGFGSGFENGGFCFVGHCAGAADF